MQMHVGDKIATLRAESGLTQAQLSALTGEGRAGVPQQTIEQLENKKNKTCRKMHLIAKALGVRLDDLIDDDMPVDQVIRINHHHALDTPNTRSETGTMQSGIDIASLISASTPRTQKALQEINEAASRGNLTDDDVELLNAIAKRLAHD